MSAVGSNFRMNMTRFFNHSSPSKLWAYIADLRVV